MIALVCCSMVAVPLWGCTSTALTQWRHAKSPVANAANPPIRVLSLWQPAQGTGIDGKTCRGMVGQVYFFTAKSPLAAKVDGAVRIYLFDDQGAAEEQVKPLHQFDFPADSWAARGQEGEFGHTYSVFVPYTRKGFHEVHCGLRIRFTPTEGGFPLYSEMTYVTLPGTRKRPTNPENADAASDAAAQSAAGAETGPRKAETTVAGLLEVAAAARKTGKAKVELSPAERERIILETRERLARETQSEDWERPRAPVRLEIDGDDEAGPGEPRGKAAAPAAPQSRHDRYDPYDPDSFEELSAGLRKQPPVAPGTGRFFENRAGGETNRPEPIPGLRPREPAGRHYEDDQSRRNHRQTTSQVACAANRSLAVDR